MCRRACNWTNAFIFAKCFPYLFSTIIQSFEAVLQCVPYVCAFNQASSIKCLQLSPLGLRVFTFNVFYTIMHLWHRSHWSNLLHKLWPHTLMFLIRSGPSTCTLSGIYYSSSESPSDKISQLLTIVSSIAVNEPSPIFSFEYQ